MSFDFDNGKNKQHLLDSLIQELQSNSRVLVHKYKLTIFKSFISTGLIFNFDIETQLKLSKLYDSMKIVNNDFKKRISIEPRVGKLIQESTLELIEILKGIS